METTKPPNQPWRDQAHIWEREGIVGPFVSVFTLPSFSGVDAFAHVSPSRLVVALTHRSLAGSQSTEKVAKRQLNVRGRWYISIISSDGLTNFHNQFKFSPPPPPITHYPISFCHTFRPSITNRPSPSQHRAHHRCLPTHAPTINGTLTS